MRILTIVGKVDTRVIAYPIARALSLNGLTAVITDDGAYRRLYHGEDLQGTVSGVDISVGLKTDEELKDSLNNSGVPYDNLVIVSSGYVPVDSTGVILCHGIDRSMVGMSKAEEEELEQKLKEEEARKQAEASKKKSGSMFGKKKQQADTTENNEETIETQEEPKEVEEAVQVKDKIIIPEGIPFVELQISYSAPSAKGLLAITLKDSYLNYIYSCEERKELVVYPDKNYNKSLAKLMVETLGFELNEAIKLLERSEYLPGKKK